MLRHGLRLGLMSRQVSVVMSYECETCEIEGDKKTFRRGRHESTGDFRRRVLASIDTHCGVCTETMNRNHVWLYDGCLTPVGQEDEV